MDKAKSVLVKFWLRKAQRDLAVAQKIGSDFPDIAIYHCQQGAEKALKSYLVLHDQDPGNTHNINTLIQEASAFKPELKTELKEAGFLTQYNQTYRYPGNPTEDFNPSPGELNKAFRIALCSLHRCFQSNAVRNNWAATAITTAKRAAFSK